MPPAASTTESSSRDSPSTFRVWTCRASDSSRRINRAVHLAGGRLSARLAIPAESYSIELWFWNGLADDARPVTGYLVERGPEKSGGDTLGLGGSSGPAPRGRLFFAHGAGAILAGKTELRPRTWHHLVLTRTGRRIAVHLDGNRGPEISGDVEATAESGLASLVIGGRHDREATFEGKIDEVAVYDRPLTSTEVFEHFRAARIRSTTRSGGEFT